MEVHIFGGTSSPSCANYALRRTADDNEDEFEPEVINTVKKNFYVDDCLKAVKTTEQAVELSNGLRELLSRGGFRLTKWSSNDKEVIEAIPESERASAVLDLDLDRDELPIERTLGVQWNMSTDKFEYSVNPKDKALNRRGILSVASSVFDPIGYLSPVILPAKMLLQDLCRLGYEWDEEVGDEEAGRWKAWLEGLPRLSEVKLERCIKPTDFGKVTNVRLHHFSDASSYAYGAVSYIRLVNSEGRIHCAFMLAKSRLGHMKPMTIPRMELSAAVLAVKLDEMLRSELELTVDESVFWSDSMAVLQYIRNENRRFHTFVANRLTAIHEGSRPHQWRYIGTDENPADDVSRGLTPDQLMRNERWSTGPAFLWKTENQWPEQPSNLPSLRSDDPEVKHEVQANQVGTEPSETLTTMFKRYSSWIKLKRAIAWLLRFRKYLKLKARKGDVAAKECRGNLTCEDVLSAETAIIKYTQREALYEVVVALKKLEANVDRGKAKKAVNRSGQNGSIHKLSPTLDESGLLRVGGRLNNASLDYESKHQAILPKRHHITDLIIRECHEEVGHLGKEYVLSRLRQRYWILKGRAAVRRVLGSCFVCRRQNAHTGEQYMADLPSERLIPDDPPFTSVGVDFFGPLYVSRGRSNVKNYGCVFTCLTTRAVHIEVTESLDTDAFINSLRRFINRRGYPRVVRSDNGTNFVGGERELRGAIAEWNQQKISNFLAQKGISWKFNPPAASHMGGIWERVIRSVRKILKSLLKNQVVTGEVLRTLMTEVEGILNSRPLTPSSDDPNDLDALTPNHLLLLRTNTNMPPGLFTKDDHYTKRRWRQVQHLANTFWKRWVSEYLPTLQERQRWQKPRRNFREGDLVLVVDERVQRGHWSLGRVTEVFEGRDGYVRSVMVKTRGGGELRRPIAKLCLLEAE